MLTINLQNVNKNERKTFSIATGVNNCPIQSILLCSQLCDEPPYTLCFKPSHFKDIVNQLYLGHKADFLNLFCNYMYVSVIMF
jgi:hypothetical protein